MSRVIAVLALAAALCASPTAFGASNCVIDGPDARISYHGDTLVFERGRRVVARIDADYTLTVDGDPIELTPEQQFIVAAYRGGFDALMVEAKEIGVAGAEFGARTAFRVLGALLTGGFAGFDESIEADTATLKAHAETLCGLAETLAEQHEALIVAVPEFGHALAD